VFQIELREGQIGDRLLDRRAPLRNIAARGVKVRLRDGARIRTLQTIQITFSAVERGLGLTDLSFAHRDPRLILLGIDGEKQVARLDFRALFEMHVLDISADLRAQLDVLYRFHPADVGTGRVDFGFHNRLDFDRRRSARAPHHRCQ